MKRLFADTHYFLAVVNTRDSAHARATAHSSAGQYRLWTTWWVLTEVGDALAGTPVGHDQFIRLVGVLESTPTVHIEPFSDGLLRLALDLYARRPDKGWSLTDCTSFLVMGRDGQTDALTGDRHFTQAGFVALLAP